MDSAFNRKELKSDIVYKRLKEMIISHELDQGVPLSERKLCDLLNASRTPIRDALKKLHSEGFVNITTDYGTFVSRVTYEHVRQVYNLREVMEGLAVRLFARSASEKEIGEIVGIYDKYHGEFTSRDYDNALKTEMAFHNYIIAHCRSEMLIDNLKPVYEHVNRIILISSYSDECTEESNIEHEKILDCIKKRDSEGAEDVMRQHVRNSKKYQLERWSDF